MDIPPTIIRWMGPILAWMKTSVNLNILVILTLNARTPLVDTRVPVPLVYRVPVHVYWTVHIYKMVPAGLKDAVHVHVYKEEFHAPNPNVIAVAVLMLDVVLDVPPRDHVHIRYKLFNYVHTMHADMIK